VGAVLYGLTYQQVFPGIARLANFGNITLPGVLNVNPFLLWGVLIVAFLFLFYLLERGLKRKDKIGD
jgi:hypothetical protein